MKHDDPFRSAKINSIKSPNNELVRKRGKIKKQRKITKEIKTKLGDAFKNKKIKTMIDFDEDECNNVKSIVVKGNTNADVTSRFIKGKMPMFSNVLLKSFVYNLIDIFCFPTEC